MLSTGELQEVGLLEAKLKIISVEVTKMRCGAGIFPAAQKSLGARFLAGCQSTKPDAVSCTGN
jgi:hypothetical protein